MTLICSGLFCFESKLKGYAHFKSMHVCAFICYIEVCQVWLEVNHVFFLFSHTCAYMYIHVHTCTYMYIHVHTCTYMYIHVHTCTYMYIHVHTCTYMYIHVHVNPHYAQCLFESAETHSQHRPQGQTLTPRSEFVPQGWILSTRGEVIPWVWNSLFAPLFF
jgi:hypothetical protein